MGLFAPWDGALEARDGAQYVAGAHADMAVGQRAGDADGRLQAEQPEAFRPRAGAQAKLVGEKDGAARAEHAHAARGEHEAVGGPAKEDGD